MTHLSIQTFLVGYAIIINVIGFALMGIDKFKARRRGFRIPEATLFIIAIIGGSVGSLLGMHVFRHKTRHRLFLIGMPAILIAQIIFILVLIFQVGVKCI